MIKSPAFLFACFVCMVALVGLTRIYDTLPPQSVGITIASGTAVLLALAKFNQRFRMDLDSITTEQLICVHAIRAPVGAAFLVMASEGLLPSLFANRAGYGDLMVSFLGLVVIAVGSALGNRKAKRAIYLAWNFVGLADLLMAVGTGIYIATNVPDSMVWIVRLPLLTVPTLILPVLFASHWVMIRRLCGSEKTRRSDL